jgi:hypothetical protein
MKKPRFAARRRNYPSSSSRSLARTEWSSRVVVSPVVCRPLAMSRSSRRMIFPERVLGSVSVKPTGASRWAVYHGLATDRQLDRIRPLAYGTGQAPPRATAPAASSRPNAHGFRAYGLTGISLL